MKGHGCFIVASNTGPSAVFVGDTLFHGGAGRFFEGTPDQFISSRDIILDHVSRQIRNILNLLAYVLVTGTALFMLYYGYVALNESILFNSRSSTPLQTIMWIPQGMWFAGLCVFSVTSFAVLVHLVMLQIRNPERGFHLYGPQTVQQEVDREVAQAEARRANAKTPGGTDDGKAS